MGINCQSQAESLKIKDIVQTKVGEKYTVEIPQPRLKIFNVYDKMEKEELLNNLILQNELLENVNIEIN